MQTKDPVLDAAERGKHSPETSKTRNGFIQIIRVDLLTRQKKVNCTDKCVMWKMWATANRQLHHAAVGLGVS